MNAMLPDVAFLHAASLKYATDTVGVSSVHERGAAVTIGFV